MPFSQVCVAPNNEKHLYHTQICQLELVPSSSSAEDELIWKKISETAQVVLCKESSALEMVRWRVQLDYSRRVLFFLFFSFANSMIPYRRCKKVLRQQSSLLISLSLSLRP